MTTQIARDFPWFVVSNQGEAIFIFKTVEQANDKAKALRARGWTVEVSLVMLANPR